MDVGWGELLLLAGVALIIFGPDKLPRAAADAGRMVRRLREMARSAQSGLSESAGVDVRGIATDLRSVADLHPKRLIGSAVAEMARADGTQDTPDVRPSRDRSRPIDQSGTPTTPPVPSSPAAPRFDPDAT